MRPHIIFCARIIYCRIDIHIQKRNAKNWENYKKQGNFFLELPRKTKTEYFKNLNVKDLSDNRKYSKSIKSYFLVTKV